MSSHNITPHPQPQCVYHFEKHQLPAHNRRFRQTCAKCAIPSVAMRTRRPQQQPSLSSFRSAEWVDTKPQKHWTHWTPTRHVNALKRTIEINHIRRSKRIKSSHQRLWKHWTHWTLQKQAPSGRVAASSTAEKSTGNRHPMRRAGGDGRRCFGPILDPRWPSQPGEAEQRTWFGTGSPCKRGQDKQPDGEKRPSTQFQWQNDAIYVDDDGV